MTIHDIISIYESAGAIPMSAGAGNRGVKGYERE